MNREGTLFFYPCLRGCLGARLLPQSYQYPNLSDGADRVAGQLRGDQEYPFSGVTKSGRVWRKVPESDARSVDMVSYVTRTAFAVLCVWAVRTTRDPVKTVGLSCC